MTKLSKVYLLVVAVAAIVVVAVNLSRQQTAVPSPSVTVTPSSATATPAFITTRGNRDIIRLDTPLEGQTMITSPLTIRGQARGNWYFEASFPVAIVNWDGLIIAQGHAEAQGDWMTSEFVPFVGTITFTSPYKAGDPDFMRRGGVILNKDNPSGLPEHDDALELTVFFK